MSAQFDVMTLRYLIADHMGPSPDYDVLLFEVGEFLREKYPVVVAEIDCRFHSKPFEIGEFA